MGRSRYVFTAPEQPHFLTLTVLHWLPIFTRPDAVDIIFNSLRYLMGEGFKVYAYVILENHLHLVAQSDQLDKDIARLKSFTARQLIAYLQTKKAKTILDQLAFYKKAHKRDRTYQLWQEGVHPELIQSEGMMRRRLSIFIIIPLNGAMLMTPCIGAIPVQETMPEWWDCWRCVKRGEEACGRG